jgi:NTE family protein
LKIFNLGTGIGVSVQELLDAFEKINIDYSSINTKVFLQTVFVRKFNIGGGLELQNLFLKSENLYDASKTIENSNYLSFVGYLNHDTFDDKYFPKKGWYLKSNFNTILVHRIIPINFQNFPFLKQI